MKPDDVKWIHRALELAARGEGLTRPNPPVGAVVVRAGDVVGEGWHQAAGRPHAEVLALHEAGSRARGATLYVTLEPCSTHGRTPPCTDHILAAGIRRVVWSATDPNPDHAGRASRLLRRYNIEVEYGVERVAGEKLLAPFAKWILSRRPYVTLKLAITMDGRIADRDGASKWITCPASRRMVQALRRRADAIWVGAGTVHLDNPSLRPRPAKGRDPWRIILDTHGHTPPAAGVYTDEHADRTLLAVGSKVGAHKRAAYARKGAEVVGVPSGRLSAVRAVLSIMAQKEILHVLCEGGGELAASLIQADVVDEYVWFMAPKIMGGDRSIGAVRGQGWRMPDLPALRFEGPQRVGDDLLIRAYPDQRKKGRR